MNQLAATPGEREAAARAHVRAAAQRRTDLEHAMKMAAAPSLLQGEVQPSLKYTYVPSGSPTSSSAGGAETRHPQPSPSPSAAAAAASLSPRRQRVPPPGVPPPISERGKVGGKISWPANYKHVGSSGYGKRSADSNAPRPSPRSTPTLAEMLGAPAPAARTAARSPRLGASRGGGGGGGAAGAGAGAGAGAATPRSGPRSPRSGEGSPRSRTSKWSWVHHPDQAPAIATVTGMRTGAEVIAAAANAGRGGHGPLPLGHHLLHQDRQTGEVS